MSNCAIERYDRCGLGHVMISYHPDYTRSFYDAYGELEWSRLEASAYGRLQAIIHTDFIQRYVDEGDSANRHNS